MGVSPEDRAADCHTLSRDQAVAAVRQVSNYNRFIAMQVISALAPCTRGDAGVLLRVYGFASSQPIRRDADSNYAPWQSNLLNVEIANRRTEAAARYLRELAGDRNIRIEPAARYQSLAQMQCQRRFNDRPDGQRRNCDDTAAVGESATDQALAQDFFTRTAHIELVNAGACQTRVTSTAAGG